MSKQSLEMLELASSNHIGSSDLAVLHTYPAMTAVVCGATASYQRTGGVLINRTSHGPKEMRWSHKDTRVLLRRDSPRSYLRLQALADQGVLRSCWMKCETRGMVKACRLPQQLMGRRT